MQGPCPRCGAELTADTIECPVCAYGDVEEIVLLEAQQPGSPRNAPTGRSLMPRVLAGLAILVVVIGAAVAVLR